MLWVKITVLDTDGKKFAQHRFTVEDDTALKQTHRITGLDQCAKYTVEVTGHYDAFFDRTVRAPPVKTRCSDGAPVSVFEVMIISLSCAVIFAAVPLLVYAVVHKRRAPTKKRLDYMLDVREIVDQGRLMAHLTGSGFAGSPGLDPYGDDELIPPREASETSGREDYQFFRVR